MIYCTTPDGRRHRYPNARLALINWFVDGIENSDSMMVMVSSGALFIDQVLAALERLYGKLPRIDRTQPEEAQCEDLLRRIYAVGGYTKMKITHSR